MFREENAERGRTLAAADDSLETEVVQDILAYLEACPCDIEHDSPLFRGTRGERLIAKVVQLAIKALRSQLGLHEDTTPRRIRRGRGLQLAASGVPTCEIIQQLGISALAVGSMLREVPLSPL
jgi:integrase/recombinase XerC